MKKRLLQLAMLVISVALLLTVSALAIDISDSTDSQTWSSSPVTSGTVAWDDSTNTLTLTDAVVEEGFYFDYSFQNVTIELVGDNTIKGDALESYESGAAIYADFEHNNCTLTIQGSGSLTIPSVGSNSAGIVCDDNLHILNTNLVIETTDDDGIDAEGNVIIENSTVCISDVVDEGIEADKALSILNSAVTIKNTGEEAIDTDGQYDSNGDVIIVNSTLTIEDPDEEGIDAAGDLSISGSTVTVKDAGYGYSALCADNITVTGSTVDVSAHITGLYAGSCVNISSDSEISATGSYGSISADGGIYVGGCMFGSPDVGAARGTLLPSGVGMLNGYYEILVNGQLAKTVFVEKQWFHPSMVEAELPFADVLPGDAMYEAVQYVYTSGLMMGTSEDRFGANGTLTRAMLWTIIARANGVSTETWLNQPWYYTAQQWVMQNGISDGTDPNGAVTKLEMVTMLWRNAGQPYAATDVAEAVPGWGLEAWRWASEAGMVAEMGGGWNAPATRGETAVCLMLS